MVSVRYCRQANCLINRVAGSKSDFTGAYAYAGYFFHDLIPAIPEPFELAFRYAFVEEPNEVDRTQENRREEFTFGAKWFFAGHNNKLTADFSHLTLEDGFLNRDVSDNRFRVQWDVSYQVKTNRFQNKAPPIGVFFEGLL